MSESNNKWVDYPGQADVRKRLKRARGDRQLTCAEVAAIIKEESGFHITGAMWEACESGVTKNVPLWAVIAFMTRLGVHPTEIFDEGY
jgi:hypothetical protein